MTAPSLQGGKQSKDPILREDMLIQRRRHKPRNTSNDEDADPLEELASKPVESAFDQAVAARLPIGRRNPNERSHARTNRRKR